MGIENELLEAEAAYNAAIDDVFLRLRAEDKEFRALIYRLKDTVNRYIDVLELAADATAGAKRDGYNQLAGLIRPSSAMIMSEVFRHRRRQMPSTPPD